MAIYARVRMGPVTWVERLDGSPSAIEAPTAAQLRARRQRAPWWALALCVGIALAFVGSAVALVLA